MIISENIFIKINSKNFNHYKNLGYEVKVGSEIYVSSLDLLPNSSYIINVKCNSCDKIKSINMKTYTKSIKKYNYYCCKDCSFMKNKLTNKLKYGVEHTFQYSEFIEKRNDNNIKKYGTHSVLKLDNIKNKIKETNIIRYGTEYASQNSDVIKKMKETRIKLGIQVPDDKVSDFILYKRLVINLTKKNKKRLFLEWDGYDYYDKEYIKDNFILKPQDKKYPSIDHKISIWYGFKNEISPNDIGDISNLCITKNIINSTKNIKNTTDFINHE